VGQAGHVVHGLDGDGRHDRVLYRASRGPAKPLARGVS